MPRSRFAIAIALLIGVGMGVGWVVGRSHTSTQPVVSASANLLPEPTTLCGTPDTDANQQKCNYKMNIPRTRGAHDHVDRKRLKALLTFRPRGGKIIGHLLVTGVGPAPQSISIRYGGYFCQDKWPLLLPDDDVDLNAREEAYDGFLTPLRLKVIRVGPAFLIAKRFRSPIGSVRTAHITYSMRVGDYKRPKQIQPRRSLGAC